MSLTESTQIEISNHCTNSKKWRKKWGRKSVELLGPLVQLDSSNNTSFPRNQEIKIAHRAIFGFVKNDPVKDVALDNEHIRYQIQSN